MMADLLVNGVKLHVEVTGTGPPVVAIHGFTGSTTTWDRLAEALDGEFTTVRVDVLGHGLSAHPVDPGRYSMEHTVADLLAVADALELENPTWLGYSMGGRILLSLATTAPERCRMVVLESASPGLRDPVERQRRITSDTKLAARIEEDGIEAFVGYWEGLPLFATQSRLPLAVREQLRAQRLRNHPAGLANSLRGIGTGAMPPLHDHLKLLAMPVCFIAGQEDARYWAIATEMAAAAAQGERAIVSGAGHAPHFEQPDVFNNEVLAFLRAHLRTSSP
jgi:2-succinyl-6-hydroxy-2,4-cyclohexadiene-1-carboxylate synthase